MRMRLITSPAGVTVRPNASLGLELIFRSWRFRIPAQSPQK
jgi:hypothetical protein